MSSRTTNINKRRNSNHSKKPNENKNIKPKRCDKVCLYYIRIAEKINQQGYQLEIYTKKDEQNVKIENEIPDILKSESDIIFKDCKNYIQSKTLEVMQLQYKKKLQEMETVVYTQYFKI